MLSLVCTLSFFFVILLIYQLLLEYSPYSIEGLTNYQPYDTNNPANALILAQQNAGNIEYIKERLDDLQGLNQEVQDISGNVVNLQTQVNGIVSAQQQYTTQMAGNSTPDITGVTSDDTTSTTS